MIKVVNHAMKDKKITIEVNSELKEKAEEIYEEMGLDLDTAFNLLLVQTLKQNRLPFEVTNKETTYEDWVRAELERGLEESEGKNGRPLEEYLMEVREKIENYD